VGRGGECGKGSDTQNGGSLELGGNAMNAYII